MPRSGTPCLASRRPAALRGAGKVSSKPSMPWIPPHPDVMRATAAGGSRVLFCSRRYGVIPQRLRKRQAPRQAAHPGGEMAEPASSVTSVDGPDRLRGSAIIAAVKASGIDFVVSVPDITTSEGLLRPLANDPAVTLVRICKEDEGVAICLGLAYCGKRALLLIQN